MLRLRETTMVGIVLLLLAFRAVAEITHAEETSLKQHVAKMEERMRLLEEAVAQAQARQRTEAAPHRQLTDQSNTLIAEPLVGPLDHLWLLVAGFLIMFMQAGFAMLETGTCRAKNAQNILMKNLSDVCLGTMCWWCFGYAFAYGGVSEEGGGNGILGNHYFFAKDFSSVIDDDGNQNGSSTGAYPTPAMNWFFQWTFCSASATIVSGGVAERVNFPAYAIYTCAMCSFIYPVVVAETWGGGFLSTINDVGYMDFGGSGIVHLTGGVGALVGAVVLGPRDGRWERPDDFKPHNLPLVVLGTFILWFGWYGFNVGSTLTLIPEGRAALAAHIAMTTTIAASSGGLTAFCIRYLLNGQKYDVAGFCNGILSGLVAVTAGCANVEVGSAAVIGCIGAATYVAASKLEHRLKIDDPLEAFPVHGGSGMWGVLAAAFFDWGKGFDLVNKDGWTCAQDGDGCISGAWAQLLAANVVEMLFIVAWVSSASVAVLFPMKLMHVLGVKEGVQDEGLDSVKHDPPRAYKLEARSSSSEAVSSPMPRSAWLH